MTRPALAAGAVKLRDDGRVEFTTKPDPKSGSMSLELDPLDFVHAVVTQVPDAKRHLVRYCSASSQRRRATARAANGAAVGADAFGASADPVPADPVSPGPKGSPEAKRRSAWRRLVNRILEVDPLLCPRCIVEMRVIARITDPVIIECILGHREQAGLSSPFDARCPPTPR